MHAKFGFHYAHCFYRKYATASDEPVFNFPGTHPPDYLDSMYFRASLKIHFFGDAVLCEARAATFISALVHEDCEHDATTQCAPQMNF